MLRRSSGGRLRLHPFVLFVTLAGVAGCAGYPARTPPLPRKASALQADRQLLLEYGQGLEYRTRLGASDLQYIDDGVLAAIEPQVGASKISERDLGEGRIVARFRKGAGGSVPRFALSSQDTVSYWLVFQRGGQFYGRFISASADTTYRITVDWHDGRPGGHAGEEEKLRKNLGWKQAIAQWRIAAPFIQGGPVKKGGVNSVPVLAQAGSAWVTCSQFGCCKTD